MTSETTPRKGELLRDYCRRMTELASGASQEDLRRIIENVSVWSYIQGREHGKRKGHEKE